jgi:hypothetical protein
MGRGQRAMLVLDSLGLSSIFRRTELASHRNQIASPLERNWVESVFYDAHFEVGSRVVVHLPKRWTLDETRSYFKLLMVQNSATFLLSYSLFRAIIAR